MGALSTLTRQRRARRLRRREPDSIGEFIEQVGPDLLDRRAVAVDHPQPLNRRCSSATPGSLTWRALTRIGNPQLTGHGARSGLACVLAEPGGSCTCA